MHDAAGRLGLCSGNHRQTVRYEFPAVADEWSTLFDHLVGGREQGLWHTEAKYL
jgi:hypothetical protein